MNQRIEDFENEPLVVNPTDSDMTREQAIAMLMAEIKKGEDSVKSESDWISSEEIFKEFGVKR